MLKRRPKTRKELLERLDAQRQSMRQHATVLPPEEAIDRRTRASADPWYFFRTYLPHYFQDAPSDFHKELHVEANRPGINALAAPRGFAKSTQETFAETLRRVVFGETPFQIIVKFDRDAAVDEVAPIQLELEENPRILADFGKLKKTGDWEDGDFITTNGCRVLAMGLGQNIRGKKHRQHRPGRVIVDDPEKDRHVKNPRINRDGVNWILEAVYPALDPREGIVTWLGTLLSRRSALSMMMARAEDAPINVRVWSALTWSEKLKAHVSLWPSRFTIEKLQQIRKLVGMKAWLQEYMNTPADDPGATFQGRMIHRFKASEVVAEDITGTFVACDPSLRESLHSDFKAIVPIQVAKKFRGKQGPFYLVRKPWIRRDTIDAMLKRLFEINAEQRPTKIGLETVSWQELLMREVRRMEALNKVRLPIVGIQNHTAKTARIPRLQPIMENGYMLFEDIPDDLDMEELINQVLGFDDPAVNDDGPDGLEMAHRLAERRVGAAVRIRSWWRR
jgi:hypothetical protein